MRLEEEIQPRNLRLRELAKERVRLREKSTLMDAEVNKIEDEIKEEFLTEKIGMLRQGAYDQTDKLENYRHELVSLIPWLGLHIVKHSDQGSVLQMRKGTTIEGGDSLRTMTEDKMVLCTGGVIT